MLYTDTIGHQLDGSAFEEPWHADNHTHSRVYDGGEEKQQIIDITEEEMSEINAVLAKFVVAGDGGQITFLYWKT